MSAVAEETDELVTHGRAPLAAMTLRWWTSLKHTQLLVVVSMMVIALVLLAAVAAPLITTRGPNDQVLIDSLLAPGSTGAEGRYLLGTDNLGRDIFTRLVYGVQPLVIIVLVSVGLAAAFGLLYGLIAGVSRGWLGTVMMRLADVQLSVPPVILAIVLAVAMSPGKVSVITAIALVTWPQTARVVRSEVLRIRESDYVQLARVAGLSGPQILRHHILPNVMNSFVVLCTLNLSVAIIFAAALSFLGLGVQPPSPSWGGMLAEGTAFIQHSWWMVAIPGLAITITVLALNVLGDRLRDILDPRIGRNTVVGGA